MSAVETIRDIPVIVEHRKSCQVEEPMDFDFDHDYTSGFPFDNSGRRSRDPLEDIAQRHPELAQHLQGFPRRSQRSAGDQDEDEYLRRRFERPFSSGRFERFGFPFDRDDFDREPQRYYEAYPEYFESFQNQNPQSPSHNQTNSPHQQPYQQHSSSQTSPPGYQEYPPQYSQEYQPQFSQQSQEQPQYKSQVSQSVSQSTQTDDCEPEPTSNTTQEHKTEGGQTRGRPIQQSNTCDLAQRQPPDEALNDRSPRSMSAPPDNKRYTSSVNIPMGVHHENQGPATGAKSQTNSGSTERVIPIHVEGRDDPVLPRNAGSTPSTQPQPERIFSDAPRPQPETIFGRRPEAFTQFVHREPHHRFPSDWPHAFGGFPEDDFPTNFRRADSPSRYAGAKSQHHQQQAQQPNRQEQPPHRQETASQAQPQEQKPSQQEPPKQPQPQKQPLGPIEQIQAIQKDVSTLLRQVEAFNGAPRDKNYLYLDEMLTRNLLKLDNVDTQGQDSIRSARKEAIKCIERAIGLLEAKAAANVAKDDKMEVEQPQQAEGEKMEMDDNKPQESANAEQKENMEVEMASQEASNKSEEQEGSQEQPKSDQVLENVKGEAQKEEVNSQSTEQNTQSANENAQNEEASKPENAATSQSAEASAREDSKENKNSGEAQSEVKEGEKKEKKKIKKKVNKEDKQ